MIKIVVRRGDGDEHPSEVADAGTVLLEFEASRPIHVGDRLHLPDKTILEVADRGSAREALTGPTTAPRLIVDGLK